MVLTAKKENQMSKFGRKDASRMTGSSRRDTSRAWHDARDHAAGSGHLKERNRNKVSDSPQGRNIFDIFDALGMTGGKKGKGR